MIDDVNRWMKGWSGYFRHGYPRDGVPQAELVHVCSIDASLATSESTTLPTPEGETFYAQLQTPRPAALVD